MITSHLELAAQARKTWCHRSLEVAGSLSPEEQQLLLSQQNFWPALVFGSQDRITAAFRLLWLLGYAANPVDATTVVSSLPWGKHTPLACESLALRNLGYLSQYFAEIKKQRRPPDHEHVGKLLSFVAYALVCASILKANPRHRELL